MCQDSRSAEYGAGMITIYSKMVSTFVSSFVNCSLNKPPRIRAEALQPSPFPALQSRLQRLPSEAFLEARGAGVGFDCTSTSIR